MVKDSANSKGLQNLLVVLKWFQKPKVMKITCVQTCIKQMTTMGSPNVGVDRLKVRIGLAHLPTHQTQTISKPPTISSTKHNKTRDTHFPNSKKKCQKCQNHLFNKTRKSI
jgi:hypothetical protein